MLPTNPYQPPRSHVADVDHEEIDIDGMQVSET